MTSLGAECYAGTITADTINYKTLNPALTGFVHNPLNSDLQGNNFDVGTAGSKVDTIYCNTLDYTALNPPINAGITNPLATDIQGNNKNIGIAGSEVNEFKGTSGAFTTTTTTTLITDDLTANSSASLPNGTTAGSLSVPTGNINIALGELNVSTGDTSLQKLDVGNIIVSSFTGAEALITNSKIKIGQNGSGESAEFSGTTLFDDDMTINSNKELTVNNMRGHGTDTLSIDGSGGLTVDTGLVRFRAGMLLDAVGFSTFNNRCVFNQPPSYTPSIYGGLGGGNPPIILTPISPSAGITSFTLNPSTTSVVVFGHPPSAVPSYSTMEIITPFTDVLLHYDITITQQSVGVLSGSAVPNVSVNVSDSDKSPTNNKAFQFVMEHGSYSFSSQIIKYVIKLNYSVS